jgi:MFS family permease
MDEELLEDRSPTYERHNVDEMLEKAGNNHRYQGMMFLVCFLGWFLAAFIQMGFPIIFHPAEFVCPEGSECSKQEACDHSYPLSDRVKSVAYTFNLACDRERYLNICFAAFLYGGFIGSLYYGEIIERRGRRYAFIEAIAMMAGGLYFSLISPNVIFFSIGVFFFNAGFRGFYNVSLLSLTEVMNELSRAATPMALSIGWALGQITIALIALFMTNWKSIFLLTAIPLTVLMYQAYRQVK